MVYGLTLLALLKVITPSIVVVGNTTSITMPACPMPASLKITTSPGAGMPRCPGGAEAPGNSRQPRPCIGRPQVEGVGGERHGVDLRVGSTHEADEWGKLLLAQAEQPGQTCWPYSITACGKLGDTRRVHAAGRLVPGIVAVRIADVSPGAGFYVKRIGHSFG